MCAHVYMAEFKITMFGIETGIEICICILVPKWVLFWMLGGILLPFSYTKCPEDPPRIIPPTTVDSNCWYVYMLFNLAFTYPEPLVFSASGNFLFHAMGHFSVTFCLLKDRKRLCSVSVLSDRV